MISICRKLSRGWNNFELMVSICRKLSPGRNQKKKVPALAQLFQPPTNPFGRFLSQTGSSRNPAITVQEQLASRDSRYVIWQTTNGA